MKGSTSSMVKANRLLEVAQSLMKQERWREAIKLLKGDSALLENDWELLWNLGWSYFKLERYARGATLSDKSSATRPQESHLQVRLGFSFS